MAAPVLLISSDPFLGASLEAVARGRLEIARLDPAHRPPAWPASPSATVVVDVTARQRDPIHTWVRRHHAGPLVILLKPGERRPAVAPDPGLVVMARPFRLIELVALLERPPAPPVEAEEAWEEEEEQEQDTGQGREWDEEGEREEGGRWEAEEEREEDEEREAEGGWEPEEGQDAGSGTLRHEGGRQPLARGGGPPRHEAERQPPLSPGRPQPPDGEHQPPPPPGGGPPPQEGERQPRPPGGGPPLGRVADRRELVARLSTPPPRGPLKANGRLPRPDWPTAAPRLAGRRRRPGWRARRVAVRVLAGVAVVLVLVGGWLGLGLVQARQDLLVGAAGVRDELARAQAALLRGQPEAAGAAVQAAERSLAVAATVPDRGEVRVAARLPVLSGGVADTRRLLAVAAGLTGAGERAVAVAPRLRAGPGALLRGDRFDLDALDDATAQAKGLVAELEAARAQLREVRGGPLEPGVDETRRWVMALVDDALGRARPLAATLDALPAALGVGQPRRYLVVLTSPEEPLAVREVVLREGAVDLRPGDGELAEAFRDTGTTAGFPATGRAWLRAAEARGRPRPDGVIALDPAAIRMQLEVTGPVAVPGHGRLDAAGVAARLTPDAGRDYSEAVLGTVVARFLTGNNLVATGRVVGAAGAAGTLRVYAADPGLRRMLASHRLDGAGQPRR